MRNAFDEERSVALSSFVNLCVLSERKDRFLGFSRSKRGLTKWLGQLDHFQNYLDTGRAIQIQGSADVEELVERLKLKEQLSVFALSTLSEYQQGRIMSVREALDELFLVGNGSIICSMREKDVFCFYLGEERSQQYFFR
jgi:hypothetical protein